jgi:hypothetical protein
MKTRISYAIAVGLILLAAQQVLADPMRCTGEEKTCNANCLKIARVSVSNCLETCRASRQIFMRTGCWNSGTSKYCGLMKQ